MAVFVLIILFAIFIITLTNYFFNVAFVKNETFDIKSTKVGKSSKLNKMFEELKENLEFIQNTPFELIQIKSDDGLILSGKMYKYPKSEKMIIFFHGYRSIAENDFSGYFKLYYELGYNILLVDQRAHGKSEGKYITFGSKERFDCLKWCEYVNENFGYINEIILGGMSMGSTTILLASGLNLPPKVKGIIADCGFSSPRDILSKVATKEYGINANIILPIVNILCLWKAKFSIYDCSVKDAMEKNKLPILFIHGISDDFVPSRMSKENYEACKTRKELVLVDCVNHGLSCMQDKEKVQFAIKKFLKSLA